MNRVSKYSSLIKAYSSTKFIYIIKVCIKRNFRYL